MGALQKNRRGHKPTSTTEQQTREKVKMTEKQGG
jgi:hypothetical protein